MSEKLKSLAEATEEAVRKIRGEARHFGLVAPSTRELLRKPQRLARLISAVDRRVKLMRNIRRVLRTVNRSNTLLRNEVSIKNAGVPPLTAEKKPENLVSKDLSKDIKDAPKPSEGLGIGVKPLSQRNSEVEAKPLGSKPEVKPLGDGLKTPAPAVEPAKPATQVEQQPAVTEPTKVQSQVGQQQVAEPAKYDSAKTVDEVINSESINQKKGLNPTVNQDDYRRALSSYDTHLVEAGYSDEERDASIRAAAADVRAPGRVITKVDDDNNKRVSETVKAEYESLGLVPPTDDDSVAGSFVQGSKTWATIHKNRIRDAVANSEAQPTIEFFKGDKLTNDQDGSKHLATNRTIRQLMASEAAKAKYPELSKVDPELMTSANVAMNAAKYKTEPLDGMFHYELDANGNKVKVPGLMDLGMARDITTKALESLPQDAQVETYSLTLDHLVDNKLKQAEYQGQQRVIKQEAARAQTEAKAEEIANQIRGTDPTDISSAGKAFNWAIDHINGGIANLTSLAIPGTKDLAYNNTKNSWFGQLGSKTEAATGIADAGLSAWKYADAVANNPGFEDTEAGKKLYSDTVAPAILAAGKPFGLTAETVDKLPGVLKKVKDDPTLKQVISDVLKDPSKVSDYGSLINAIYDTDAGGIRKLSDMVGKIQKLNPNKYTENTALAISSIQGDMSNVDRILDKSKLSSEQKQNIKDTCQLVSDLKQPVADLEDGKISAAGFLTAMIGTPAGRGFIGDAVAQGTKGLLSGIGDFASSAASQFTSLFDPSSWPGIAELYKSEGVAGIFKKFGNGMMGTSAIALIMYLLSGSSDDEGEDTSSWF